MAQRRTHDARRHGSTNPDAALEVASGTVITDLANRHRALEVRRFLARTDQAAPVGLAVHLICDNASTTRPSDPAPADRPPASSSTSPRPTAPG